MNLDDIYTRKFIDLCFRLISRSMNEKQYSCTLCCWWSCRSFCPPPFRRKAEGHSFRLSVLPSVCPSVPLKFYVPCVRNSSYSFMPILSKLYRCFCHGLKIRMWFGYYPEIIFCHFLRNLNLVIFRRFYYQSEWIVGILCAQLLLQFYADSFETSQVI